ncbi:MAG: hypothetical protein JJ953_07525 [Gracilimonas sp.]|uniref:hypothetical protein n=1 Tax=Gracilimonas TaxID=649462 RepID=UPI001B0A538C|nr:hypothetical protein [Gracilimonas sp.]MBO6585934.1 hypothetical protein [Gracilimonas sp.]MBO6616931.1 hypothetical protein [Gracilimonas sp.]
MKLNKQIIKILVSSVKATHEHELGCGECFDEIHEFAEMELLGKSPAKAKPLVKEHLEKCGECREEYKALLKAMENLEVYQ